MKLAQKLAVSVIAGTALLTVTPAAFAATSSAAQPVANTALRPAAYKYLYYSSYPTYNACATEGRYLQIHINNSYLWKCPEYNEGDYFIYKLYVVLGHPPGS
jgi:hypothetical protein